VRHSTRRSVQAWLFLAPHLVLFFTFVGLPMFLAIVVAFKDFQSLGGITGSPWVGFRNFTDLFTHPTVRQNVILAFKNTLLFSVIFVPVNLFASLIVASLIHPLSDRAQAFYRAAFFLPTVTSAVIMAMIWRWLYDTNFGLINQGLRAVGLSSVGWLSDPKWAMWSVIIAAVGVGPGGNILIYLAAMSRVPKETLEAAEVDGATGIQRWWFVTVPQLRTTTLYLLVLNTIGSFQVFDLVFILTGAGPAHQSTVIVYEIFDLAFRNGAFGPACALSLILMAIIVAVALIQFRVMPSEEAAEPGEPGILSSVFDRLVFRPIGTGALVMGRALTPLRVGLGRAMEALPTPRGTWPIHAVLLPLAILLLIPMAWMFLSAFTPNVYLTAQPPQISLSHFSTDNYRRLFDLTPVLPRWVWNTVSLSLGVTVGQVFLSCLAGFVFAKMRFPGRGPLFSLLLASIMLPGQALVIPLFMVIGIGFRDVLGIDIIDTHWAILLPGLISPVGIFLMRQFIQTLPRDLDEAARIDGCSELGIFARVVLPLCKPIMAAWGILTFTATWKNFFWPFVVLGSERLFTLEVGLQSLQQQNVTDFGLVMAGATMSAVPMILVFFLFQKQIVKGLTLGAIKG
jgi:multiple sugar transport system permease protein